jgi:pimeloyl-ACP methyl ester carboxylesterase
VVVHGFSAEGFLYAQSLSRLVNMGFRVIAIDTAGHGATQGLPLSGMKMDDYADLLGRVIDHLGITRYVLAGHSMGGQLIARLGASRPEQVLGIIFIDAIVGDTWDRMVYLFRVSPPLLAVIAGILVVDSVSVLPTFSNPVQAAKLFRLVVPTVWGHMTRPWRLAGPALSIMRTRSSRYALNTLKDNSVTCVAIHGSLDLAVPHMTAIDTVNRTSGTLVTIDGGGHSWILRDPETLPAILAELLEGDLGKAISSGLRQAGLRRAPARRPQVARNVEGRNGSGNNGSGHNGDGVAESTAWVGKGIRTADIEAVCYNPDAMIFDLAPPDVPRKTRVRQRAPRYRWSTL